MSPRPCLFALAAALAVACEGGRVGAGDGDGGDADAGATCGDGEVTGGEVCDDGVNDERDGGCLPGCGELDDSDELFAREIVRVQIDLEAAAWTELRREIHTVHQAYGGADCRARPMDAPYRWRPATVSIDGEAVGEARLRKKGLLGSQSTRKPSLKLRLDGGEGRRFHGLRGVSLVNNKIDPSGARTCLAYRVFAAAGALAPRCTAAAVTVNGEPLGVFTLVEEIGDDFLARRLADAGGNLYEGTVNDFRAELVGGFEQETNQDTDATRANLLAVTEVLATADDASLLAALEPLVDLDDFYRYWAAEALVWHRDGYSGAINNFYVHADQGRGGRLRFLPWGPDGALVGPTNPQQPDSVMAYGALAFRLYQIPEAQARFHQALDELLTTAWDEAALVGELDRIGAVVAAELTGEPALAEHTAAREVSRLMIEGRRAAIAADLAAGPPAWTNGMRGSPCRIPTGPIEVTFSTTWDTLGLATYDAGSGTVAATLAGGAVAPVRVGARAGLLEGGNGRVQLAVELAGQRELIITADLPDVRWFDAITAPGTYRLVRPELNASLQERDLTTSPPTVLARYELGEGSITFEALEDRAGAPFTGHLSATLWQLP